MENIKISKICGLCAGCKFAVNTTLKELSNKKNVTLFKEIVHNKNVNNMLISNGVLIEDNLENLENANHVILRAHGEPPSTYNYLIEHNIPYTDCTCFNVTKIHNQIKTYSDQGYQIVIIGKYGKTSNVMHPEILGDIGYSNTPVVLIEDESDLTKLSDIGSNKIYLTCQTTFNAKKAENLISQIENLCKVLNKKLVTENSICSAQKNINNSSLELAKESDLMIVVGGKNSSNTKELYENMKTVTTAIFLEDINLWKDAFIENQITLSKNLKIGITAGASTLYSELETLKAMIEKEKETLGE